MKSPSVIEAKFLRSKTQASFTKLWKEVNQGDKELILNNVNLLVDEAIIIYFLPNQTYWWLLTNKRLIIADNQHVTYVPLAEVKRVEAKEIFEDRVSKSENTNLSLYFLNDGELKLKLEQQTWPVIYEVLKFITADNQKG